MDPLDGLHDVRITRRLEQFENEPGGIELAEWLALLATDPSLERLDYIWGRNPQTGEPLQVALPGGVKCVGHPMWWHNGEIVTYSVDGQAVAKAKALASALGAECIVSLD